MCDTEIIKFLNGLYSGTIHGYNVNMRIGPGTSFSVRKILQKGYVVSFNPIHMPTNVNGYTWYFVTYNGMNGWVAGQYITGA